MYSLNFYLPETKIERDDNLIPNGYKLGHLVKPLVKLFNLSIPLFPLREL